MKRYFWLITAFVIISWVVVLCNLVTIDPISPLVEIFPDLCDKILEVGQAEEFRLIMMKPTIDELATLKESTSKI